MANDVMIYDAIVVGGGMVGAAAALGLAQAGWSVALIEHQAPATYSAGDPPDLRVSAIGCSAIKLLERLGAWQHVEPGRATPYRRLETWEWENAKVEFDANDLNLPELGYMVENNLIQSALWQQFRQAPSLTVITPAQLDKMQRSGDLWQITLDNRQRLSTRLVIGADGANSAVRQQAGIGITGWQYRQSCMLIRVKTGRKQQDVTWQQFYPSGPRAFLPLFDDWASLVWYDSPAKIKRLQAMSMQQLTQAIAEEFPERLGRVEASAAASFPLTRRHARQYAKDGVVLLGDAAHTINPLAGQGVNLGYRDVEVLLDVLLKARQKGHHYYNENVLKRYEQRRRTDNLLMQAGMDVFYKVFSNELPPVKIVRNLALMAAQKSGKLKEWALRYALGIPF